MERADLLLVVPPPHIADLRLRRHWVKRNILVLSGHHMVRGLVHMMPGTSLDRFVARSGQHFLPLTDSWVTSTEWPEIDERHPALLVNVRSTAQRLKLEVLGRPVTGPEASAGRRRPGRRKTRGRHGQLGKATAGVRLSG